MFDYYILILVFAAAAIMYRLVKGPSIADRVAAFDVLTCSIMGVISLLAVTTNKSVFLDVVLTMSLVVFLGAVAFSYYLQKRKN